jgi:Transglutaminase-like superfamily
MSRLAEAILSLRIALFAACVPWLVRLPVRRLEARVNPPFPPPFADAVQAERIIRLTQLICRVARALIDHPCQVRGLTLYYFLRRAGVNVSLVFGIGRVDAEYAGHCWLVKDGEPFLEIRDPREYFTAMYTFNSDHSEGATNSARATSCFTSSLVE